MPENRKLLGRRIRSLRRARDLSQEQLAEKAGISDKYLGELERGQKNVSVSVVERISAALDVEISDLLDFGHEKGKTDLRREIATLANRASDRDLQTILRVLKSVLE